MATMFEALAAFDQAAPDGPHATPYFAALAMFARVDVESLEDISSLLGIAAAVIRAGQSEIGVALVEKAQTALNLRLRKLRRNGAIL